MDLPCEICVAKMPPKSKHVEIGDWCFLNSASILLDTAVQETHWIGTGIWLGLICEYGKPTLTGAGKGSKLGIEPGYSQWHIITNGKIHILELQIHYFYFLTIGPPFE
jgi:hypothetical protein